MGLIRGTDMDRNQARDIIKTCHRDINDLTEEYDQVTCKLQDLYKQLSLLQTEIKNRQNKKREIYEQLVELQKTQIQTICLLEDLKGEEDELL